MLSDLSKRGLSAMRLFEKLGNLENTECYSRHSPTDGADRSTDRKILDSHIDDLGQIEK